MVVWDNAEDLLAADDTLADDHLRRFLERAAATDSSLLLVLTTRTPLRFPPELQRFDVRVELDRGLPTADAVALLRDLDPDGRSGLRDAPDAQLAHLAELCGARPRALEHVHAILTHDRFLTVDELVAGFHEQHELHEQLAGETYRRLPEEGRRVVEALAVFRRPVEPVAVAYLLEPFVPALPARALLSRLVDSHVVTLDAARRAVSLHPLDQRLAYARIPVSGAYSRAALERRAAAYYAELAAPLAPGHTIVEVEPHQFRCEHLVRAGAYDEAAAVLSAVDVDHLVWHGYARLVRELRAQLDGRLTDPRQRVLHAYSLANVYRVLGPLDRAIEWLQSAMERAAGLGETDIERESRRTLGEALRISGDLPQAAVHLEASVDAYRTAGVPARVAWGLAQCSLTYTYRGEPERGLATAADSLREAATVPEGVERWTALGFAHDAASLAHLRLGDLDSAERAVEEAVAAYQKVHQPYLVGYVVNVRGLVALHRGDLDAARRAFAEARQAGLDSDYARVVALADYNLALTLRRGGDLDAAIAAARSAVRVLADLNAPERPAADRALAALRALAAGDRPAALEALLGAAEAARHNPDLYPADLLVREVAEEAEATGLTGVAARAAGALRPAGPRAGG